MRSIVQIASTVLLTAILPLAGFAGAALAVASAAGGAAIATGLSGGNLGQVLRAGLIAGLTAAAFFEVGDLTLGPAHASPAFDSPEFNAGNFVANVAGHALVGCASSAASGGSCESGALSGGITAGAGPLINGQNQVASLVANAVLGGVASVAGGGKFANGAITGAFGYLFNAVAGTFNRATGLLTLTDLDTGATFSGKFLSGGVGGDELPDGTYSILERNGKDEFRLEAQDATFGDDRVDDSDGRGLFRLHGPGISNGCVAACDLETWNAARDFINATSTTLSPVNTYYGYSFFGGTVTTPRFQTGTEQLKNFGNLKVQ